MSQLPVMRCLTLLAIVCLGVTLLLPVQVTLAAPLPPPSVVPMPHPTETPPDTNPINNFITNIISFPFKDLQATFENLFKGWLTEAVVGESSPLRTIFNDVVTKVVGTNPDVITPVDGSTAPSWWGGGNVFQQAWTAIVVFAVALWPLTLAIIAVIAAKDAVAAASWGLGDLKQVLGEWLLAVVLSATSIYWIDWVNQISNAMTVGVLTSSMGGAWAPNVFTLITFGAAATVITASGLGTFVAIFITLFVIILAVTLLSALVMQYMTRFVLLLIVVALAPVILILGVLPPLGWVREMWLKTFVQVMLLGPVNALALKFAIFLGGEAVSQDPATALVHMMGMLGVLSILLAIDGAITSQVFGAMQEVLQRTTSSMASVATMALAAASFGVGGVVAGGGLAAGETGAAAGAEAAAGGAEAASGASAAKGAAGAASGSFRKPSFDHAAGLRIAGRVMAKQGGLMGAAGGMIEGVGATAQEANRESRAEHREADRQAFATERDDKRSKEQLARDAKSDARVAQVEARASASDQHRQDRESNEDQRAYQSEVRDREREGHRALGEYQSAAGSSSGGAATAGSSVGSGSSAPAPSSPAMPYNAGLRMGDQLSAGANPTTSVPANTAGPEPHSTAAGTVPPAATPLTDFSQSNPYAPSIERPRAHIGRSESGSGSSFGAGTVNENSLGGGNPTGAAMNSSGAPSAPAGLALSSQAQSTIGSYFAPDQTPASQAVARLAAAYGEPAQQVEAAHAASQALHTVGLDKTDAFARNTEATQNAMRGGLPLESLAADAGFAGRPADYLAHRAEHPLSTPADATLSFPSIKPGVHTAPGEWDHRVGSAVSQAFGLGEHQTAFQFRQSRDPREEGSWTQAQLVASAAHQAIHDPHTPNGAESFLTQLGLLRDRGAVSNQVYNSWSAVMNSRRGS